MKFKVYFYYVIILILLALFTSVFYNPFTTYMYISNNNFTPPDTQSTAENIDNIHNEITQDTLNYTFKKEEIISQLEHFKIEYINTINKYLANNNYQLASNYLNKFIHLFSSDSQITNIKKYIDNKLKNISLTEYNGEIEVLSFTPLIAFPKQVLNENNPSSTKLDENSTTCDEFKKILLSLYEKNYILISPHLLNGDMKTPTLLLPANKKPLILLLESAKYSVKSHGSVDRLILDRNDKIATYTPKRSINDRIHYDNDFVTILNDFVSTHPSFSFNGARGVISIDGSDGIFGYNTQISNATSKYEIKKVTQIINTLKEDGYTFISRGYGGNIKDTSITLANALNTWNNHTKDIVGDTNIFFLTSNISAISDNISEKIELLNSYNYNYFIGIGTNNCYEYNSTLNGIYLQAKKVNGNTLRYSSDTFSHLFDSEKIYDHINRNKTYNI